jgi:integrase
VLAIPPEKTTAQCLGPTEAELAHLLAQVERETDGERDYLLLALLMTPARIQEPWTTPRDCHLGPRPSVDHGKARRERLCPLLPQTARLITRFPPAPRGRPMRLRRWWPVATERLTRHGARYLLGGVSRPGARVDGDTQPAGREPPYLRHTAMHLLQANVPLVTIKDVLGHADVKSTEVYVQIDLAMKREALTRVGSPATPIPKGGRLPEDLLRWLEAL